MADTLPLAPPYEPPRIERVLTPEELAHEVLYAGSVGAVVSTDADQHM